MKKRRITLKKIPIITKSTIKSTIRQTIDIFDFFASADVPINLYMPINAKRFRNPGHHADHAPVHPK